MYTIREKALLTVVLGSCLLGFAAIALMGNNNRLVTRFSVAPSRYSSDTESDKYHLEKSDGTLVEISQGSFTSGVSVERRKRIAMMVAMFAILLPIVIGVYVKQARKASVSRKELNNLLELKTGNG